MVTPFAGIKIKKKFFEVGGSFFANTFNKVLL